MNTGTRAPHWGALGQSWGRPGDPPCPEGHPQPEGVNACAWRVAVWGGGTCGLCGRGGWHSTRARGWLGTLHTRSTQVGSPLHTRSALPAHPSPPCTTPSAPLPPSPLPLPPHNRLQLHKHSRTRSRRRLRSRPHARPDPPPNLLWAPWPDPPPEPPGAPRRALPRLGQLRNRVGEGQPRAEPCRTGQGRSMSTHHICVHPPCVHPSTHPCPSIPCPFYTLWMGPGCWWGPMLAHPSFSRRCTRMEPVPTHPVSIHPRFSRSYPGWTSMCPSIPHPAGGMVGLTPVSRGGHCE